MIGKVTEEEYQEYLSDLRELVIPDTYRSRMEKEKAAIADLIHTAVDDMLVDTSQPEADMIKITRNEDGTQACVKLYLLGLD